MPDEASERLRSHDVTLEDGPLRLRPMTENDWPVVMQWTTDPDVLYYSEGDDVSSRTLEETQMIYRGVSREAFVFMAELDGEPIGDCWLQRMNLERILDRYPGKSLWRIDLQIGAKNLWGKGWGTRIIRLLIRHAFSECDADAVFGCDIADYNPRSRRAFEKNGFVVDAVVPQPEGRKSKVDYDMILMREGF